MRTQAATTESQNDDGLDEVMEGFGSTEHRCDPAAEDTTDYTGTQLVVHWGREHIQPLRFQGMDLGPFSMEIVVHEGESPLQASQRAMRHMNAMAQEELDEKLPRFIARCKAAANES